MTVEFSGPLFDGTAGKLLERGAEAAEEQVALSVRDQVRQILRRSARRPTGYYESRVVVERARGDRVVRNDLVYDDWLEGNSRRNSASRFKGYRHWERAAAQAEGQAGRVAEQVLGPYIDRMG
ncbi:MAG TPA: hypothetical protein VGP26_24580 [Actinophytocola sp.]|jgi:hypothetical protein|nr:hypothetical protein [Actinophytocola sp.]